MHSDKIRNLSSYEYYFQNIEEDIENDDENDLDYLENLHFNLVQQLENVFAEYEIDYVLKNPTINKKSKINKEETINKEQIINKEEIINNELAITKDTSTFIKTPEWLKKKKCSINQQNKDNKCFQYSVTLSFHHQQITGRNLFRISKIKPYINIVN